MNLSQTDAKPSKHAPFHVPDAHADDPESALRFERVAQNAFYPVYSALAKQIVARTGITEGQAVDIGCGSGHLGLSLAKTTRLAMTLFDINAKAVELTAARAKRWGLLQQVHVLQADVLHIPLDDGSMRLAVSRGSIAFWPDKVRAFHEIDRILEPGGFGYIGGGFASTELTVVVEKKLRQMFPDWEAHQKRVVHDNTGEDFAAIVSQAGIRNAEITDDERGFWIVWQKSGTT